MLSGILREASILLWLELFCCGSKQCKRQISPLSCLSYHPCEIIFQTPIAFPNLHGRQLAYREMVKMEQMDPQDGRGLFKPDV